MAPALGPAAGLRRRRGHPALGPDRRCPRRRQRDADLRRDELPLLSARA
ncbi:MAG: hypothetical protein M0C28_20390 [Candidatus Moduliflexus flocculans]|nr:hypothetical protein [Candidatus Moduliflexus flocculans]